MSEQNTSKIEPKILQGFLELLPAEQILFNKMMDIIRSNYERFGFVPLDTPVIERAEILLAKAGGETEQQIYRFTKGENDLALRFDLTVPLARYVAMHYNDLSFPFRRYHLGKSYRGERPQAGRFREFYQCDIDIIGNGELSIINDAELPGVIYNTFKEMGFENFTIKINNRRVLNGFFEFLKLSDKTVEILRVIDKIDKIGKENIIKELKDMGLEDNAVDKIIEFIHINGSNAEIISKLRALGIENTEFNTGLNELEQVSQLINKFGVPLENYKIDLTIARGLGYYTGTVYETILNDYPQLGSVCSGGRYDNLAEHFTEKKLPGVGISIGLSRLFYQLNKIGLVKGEASTPAKVLVISMLEDLDYPVEVATKLRQSGINTEIFTEKKKIGAQFKYADKQGIPFVVVVGEDELKGNFATLKDMKTGNEQKLPIDGIVVKIK